MAAPADKTIKLWKVFEKSLKVVQENNLSSAQQGALPPPTLPSPAAHAAGLLPPSTLSPASTNTPHFKLPRMAHHDTIVAAVPRKVFANAHAYHINSISINSDGETYMSADDLRINLWNLAIHDQSFNVLDIKPVNMEELTEVITAAEFHPISCNLFCYSSSKGTVKLADMRDSALCDQHAKSKPCPRTVERARARPPPGTPRTRPPPTTRSSARSSRPSRTSSSPRTAATSSPATTSPSASGTSTWTPSPSRPSPSTTTSGASSATCTRTTASLTSLSAPFPATASAFPSLALARSA
jgi:hypothetical protein